jgi:hypothetical protein
MVMDVPPFPCGRAFTYILDADGPSEPFHSERAAKSAAEKIKGDWRIRAFAEDRVDHNLVMFKTLHHDGTIDAAPPAATSHYAILKDMPEAKCLFEYDVHGAIDRVLGSTFGFCVFYERLCVLFPPGPTRSGAHWDCLRLAQDVVCAPLWRKSRQEAEVLSDWCRLMMYGGNADPDLF